MIFFFGTRPGKKRVQQLHGVSCEYCNQRSTLTAISQDIFIHVFWLPLLKIGTSRYAECSHCKRVYYKEEFTKEMQKVLD